MARINLLPWREAAKKKREKNFYIATGVSAALSLVVILIVHMEMEDKIKFQKHRNQYLTEQISVLDNEIKEIKTLELSKARLLNRMKVIQQLQKSRPEIVHLYEELVLATPEGAQLLSVTQEGSNIKIEGIAESNSRISSFMRNMDKSPWLTDPELIVINAKTKEHPNFSWFSLKVRRSRPNEKS